MEKSTNTEKIWQNLAKFGKIMGACIKNITFLFLESYKIDFGLYKCNNLLPLIQIL